MLAEVERSQPVRSTQDAYLGAARNGLGFCQKVNKKTGINAAPTVLTDAGLIRTTASGYHDIITCFYSQLNTASDWCEFEIGYTANADGTGAFTALTPLFRIESSDKKETATIGITRFSPPMVVTNAMGKAWTIRAQTNDGAASVTFGINGWREEV